MITIDVQPYSVVEDDGFKGVVRELEPRYVLPCWKYFSTNVIPEMYESTRARVQSEVDHAKSVCLTAATWMAQNTTQSFISLTAHWVTTEFTRRSAVLQCQLFEGSHTGIRLASTSKLNRDESIDISRDDYKDGFTLYAFDLTAISETTTTSTW